MPLIPTNSGKWIDLGLVRPEDVVLADIAWHLAGIARFTGATSPAGYSVGEHSVRVEAAVQAAGGDLVARRQALLHDAAEAYLGDVTSPLKALLPTYRALEAHAWGAVSARFDLPGALHPLVIEADARMCATEFRDLMAAALRTAPAETLATLAEPYIDVQLTYPWAFQSTLATFLGKAEELGLK